MKNFYTSFYFTRKLILIMTLILFNNASLASESMEESESFDKTRSLLIDNSLNELLNDIKAQRDHFEHILDYLALLVYGDTAKFSNKEQIVLYIQQTREIILQLKNTSLIIHSPNLFLEMQLATTALCQNLQMALLHNQWQPINLDATLKQAERDSQTGLDELLEETTYLFNQNKPVLKKLESTVERFGLTFSQKTVRNLEDFYNSSLFYLETHKLTPYLKYGFLGTAVASYAIYHSEYLAQTKPIQMLKNSYLAKIWNNSIARSLKKIVGSAPAYIEDEKLPKELLNELNAGMFKAHPKYSYPVSNLSDLSLIGKAEWSLGKLAKTETNPSILIPGAALGWFTNEIMEDSKISTFGLFASSNPMLRMAAWTNFWLQVKQDNRYRYFKIKAERYLKLKYEQLRGKTNKKNEQPTNTFDDIIGLNDQKRQFEEVIDYVINPEKFERTGNKPAKGYLMMGKSRTGKSYIAKAVCGEINARQKLLGKPATVNFISLSADEIMQSNFDNIMNYINNQAPCVVFIDEIDLLCLNRGNGEKENPLLSQFLTHMSGTFSDATGRHFETNNKQVIFIAATNNPHNIDSALLKSGRFSKIIHFDYPHLEERMAFIVRELAKRAITTLSQEFKENMAKELEGCSFEDISLIIAGAIQSASMSYTAVTQTHFESSINENLKCILPQSKTLSAQETATITTYQAGKALATILLTPQLKISTVTIKPINKKIETRKNGNTVINPTIQHGGLFTYQNQNLLDLKNEQDLLAECQILLAGHLAQEILMGSSCYTYRPEDQQTALGIAKQIALAGENYNELTDDLQKEVLHKAHAIKNECKQKIKLLLNNNKAILTNLIQVLQEQKILSGKEIKAITGL